MGNYRQLLNWSFTTAEDTSDLWRGVTSGIRITGWKGKYWIGANRRCLRYAYIELQPSYREHTHGQHDFGKSTLRRAQPLRSRARRACLQPGGQSRRTAGCRRGKGMGHGDFAETLRDR